MPNDVGKGFGCVAIAEHEKARNFVSELIYLNLFRCLKLAKNGINLHSLIISQYEDCERFYI